MVTEVTTAVDLFVDGDLEHPFASLKRVGGGRWQAHLYGTDPRTNADKADTASIPGERLPGFPTYGDCLDWCKQIAALVDNDPALISPHAAHANALVADRDDQLAAAHAAHASEMETARKRIEKLEADLAAKKG